MFPRLCSEFQPYHWSRASEAPLQLPTAPRFSSRTEWGETVQRSLCWLFQSQGWHSYIWSWAMLRAQDGAALQSQLTAGHPVQLSLPQSNAHSRIPTIEWAWSLHVDSNSFFRHIPRQQSVLKGNLYSGGSWATCFLQQKVRGKNQCGNPSSVLLRNLFG